MRRFINQRDYDESCRACLEKDICRCERGRAGSDCARLQLKSQEGEVDLEFTPEKKRLCLSCKTPKKKKPLG